MTFRAMTRCNAASSSQSLGFKGFRVGFEGFRVLGLGLGLKGLGFWVWGLRFRGQARVHEVIDFYL